SPKARRFFWKDHWIEVNEILDRWYQARPDPEWPLANYFKVAGDDGRQYLLKHDQESNEWFMGREW
ncbi:MAG: hypothetical protein M1608_10850, partial [Candidatus Omnitrophica bacterium]|nr:hypothetical protein [Candidatus Omnitrophota bacterium]